MSARVVVLAGLLAAGCKPVLEYKPPPLDPRLGSRVDESSPLRPYAVFLEHHQDSITMVAFDGEGFDVDLQSKEAGWRVKRLAVPGFASTDLPPPPLPPTNAFRMGFPMGPADVDVVFTDTALVVREGKTWSERPALPRAELGSIRYLVVSGPDAMLVQTEDKGVWTLRGDQWVQLAPDLGPLVTLVARDGDRVRLVAGEPPDPATKAPAGKATIALVSASTGQRLAPDLVPGGRLGGLLLTGLHGSVDDFELFLGERGIALNHVRRVRYKDGALIRQARQNQFRLEPPLPMPGSPTLQTRGLPTSLLFAPDGLSVVQFRLVIEEARRHLTFRELELTAPFVPIIEAEPLVCPVACQAPLVCLEGVNGMRTCGTPEVPVEQGVLPVTIRAHLEVPPTVPAERIDIIVWSQVPNKPAPDFDVVRYGPEVELAVEAGVAGTVLFNETTLGLNAFAHSAASDAGTVIDLGTISFGSPTTTFSKDLLIEDVQVDPAGLMLAKVDGKLSYVAFTNNGGLRRIVDTGISGPTTTRFIPLGGLALVTSAAGTTIVPNGFPDGGAAGPIDPPGSPLDVSRLVMPTENATYVVPHRGGGQQPATMFWATPRVATQPGEADALSPNGIIWVRREGNELVRRSRNTSPRTVFLSDLTGPAAFLVPNDSGNERVTDPSVVIAEGATPSACLGGRGTASCSVRLRPAGGSFSIPVSTSAKFVAIDRLGRGILLDEGAGPARYDVNARTKTAVPLPSGFVTTEVEQVGDVTELFGADGRVVIYELSLGMVVRTLPAMARTRRTSRGGIIQTDACGAGDPCAVQSYFPRDDTLTNFGPGSARGTITEARDRVMVSNDSLQVFPFMPERMTLTKVSPGYHVALVPPFDDAVTTYGTPCAFFKLDATFNGTARLTGCAEY